MTLQLARKGNSRSVGRLGAACLAMVMLVGGCPAGSNPTPPDNTNDNTDGGDAEAEIISPSTSFGISSLDPPISVLYSVPEAATEVSGFRVPVADSSPDGAPIGDRVVIATSLATGEMQAFSFDPAEAEVGFFRVGILFTLDADEESVESTGVIQVQGSPDPVFIQPSEPLTEVVQGSAAFVSFDVGDPEGNVQWRLFILAPLDSRTNPPDQLGTQLAVGSGNVGTFTLDTSDFSPADYQLGLSATDSGASVAVTVDRGETDRIVTVPNGSSTPILRIVAPSENLPPTIVITAPGATDVGLFQGDAFTIRFTGQVNEPGAVGRIDIFYDTDRNLTNGYSLIEADLPVTTTTAAFPTDLPEGTYFVGATINDGINAPQSVYADGRVIVVEP